MLSLEEFVWKFTILCTEDKDDVIELMNLYEDETNSNTIDTIVEIVENKQLEVKSLLSHQATAPSNLVRSESVLGSS